MCEAPSCCGYRSNSRAGSLGLAEPEEEEPDWELPPDLLEYTGNPGDRKAQLAFRQAQAVSLVLLPIPPPFSAPNPLLCVVSVIVRDLLLSLCFGITRRSCSVHALLKVNRHNVCEVQLSHIYWGPQHLAFAAL